MKNGLGRVFLVLSRNCKSIIKLQDQQPNASTWGQSAQGEARRRKGNGQSRVDAEMCVEWTELGIRELQLIHGKFDIETFEDELHVFLFRISKIITLEFYQKLKTKNHQFC